MYVDLKLVSFIKMYAYESLAQFQLKHEFTMVVAGPSKSGKTEFVKQLVQNTQWISPPPEKIVWCYREWQKVYESLQDSVTFVKNIPSDDEKLVADLSTRHLLIFDDMMGSKAIESIVDWFTRKAHHRNTSVIYITQNFFDRAAQHWTITIWYCLRIPEINPRSGS
jgi:septin family protein